jgi:hypothetical protein
MARMAGSPLWEMVQVYMPPLSDSAWQDEMKNICSINKNPQFNKSVCFMQR